MPEENEPSDVPPTKRVVRDAVHGYISFDEIDATLIDSPLFQRLRLIRQNDVASLVYPSMTTTRFEHSLGVFHMARLVAEASLRNALPGHRNEFLSNLCHEFRQSNGSDTTTAESAEKSFVRAAKWYGLLHDIGHLPYSHLTEDCLREHIHALYSNAQEQSFSKIHEAAGAQIIDDAHIKIGLSKDPMAAWLVRELLTNKKLRGVFRPLKDMVDSDVDVDRIDATSRDGLMSGGEYGHFDATRLARDATLCKVDEEYRCLFTSRSLSAIENLILERVKLYRWVHFQQKVVAFKAAYRVCFEDVIKQAKCGSPHEWTSEWVANNYKLSSGGFLDDGYVRQRIAALKPSDEYSRVARDIVLCNSRGVWSLWKRSDDFHHMSRRLADLCNEHTAESKEPILNRLAEESQAVEVGLQKRLDDERLKYKVICWKNHLMAFEPRPTPGSGSELRIISKDGKFPKLTDESTMVQSLEHVVNCEPRWAVAVIPGDGKRPDESQMKSLRELFYNAASDVFKKLTSSAE